MKTISHIELISENCDYVSVIAKDIVFFLIRKISGEASMTSDRQQMETVLLAEDVSMAFENESLANPTHLGVSLFDLIKQRDFTRIDVFYCDGSNDLYYLPWCEKDVNVNLWQNNCFTEENVVIVNIKKEN